MSCLFQMIPTNYHFKSFQHFYKFNYIKSNCITVENNSFASNFYEKKWIDKNSQFVFGEGSLLMT